MDCCCYRLSSLRDSLSRNKYGITWKKAAKSLNIQGFSNLPGYKLLFIDENRRQMLCLHSHFLHLLRGDESKQKGKKSKYIHYCYYKRWNSNQAQSFSWLGHSSWGLTTPYFDYFILCLNTKVFPTPNKKSHKLFPSSIYQYFKSPSDTSTRTFSSSFKTTSTPGLCWRC